MFEKIIGQDKELLIYLNNLGNPEWDEFWLFITNQFNWIPVFLVVIFLFFRYLGWKKGLLFLVVLAIMVTFSDQFTNFIRVVFSRLRPNNDPEIQDQLRILINPQNFSFTSGHATTSTTVTVFAIRILRRYTKLIYLFVLFPLFFAYSRLYLGVHFPIDIITGASIGATIGYSFSKLYEYLCKKIFWTY
ncbi:phosphatase PAP2 family protein [Flavicella marina]|uniref:phosphatase PAP2 family protein n=1 Tax=Flavicella marina TaxID=1475951 RepID=UPI001264DBE0|nr:phosphatase PAP2 family protein [Flavicella marina]